MKNDRENQQDGAMPELTLRDVLSPLFRHRRMMIISFCGVFAAATLVAWLWAAHYYVATMQVVVEQDRSDPTVSTTQVNVNGNRPITTDQVSSEVALLQGADMMRTIVADCGLVTNKSSWSDIFLPNDPKVRTAMKQEGAARGLVKKIKVEVQTSSDVIDVKYGRAGEPEVPACVLQTLGKLYLEKHLQLARPVGTTDFFAQEANKYRQSLEDSEKRLTDFSRTEGVAAPELLRTDMAQQLALAETSLNQAQQAIAGDQKRLENIKTQMATTPSRSPTEETTNSSYLLMQNLQASLLAAQVKRTQMLLKYEPTYPLVKEVDEEIAETKDAIANASETKYVNRATDRDPTYEFLRQDQAKTEADLASQKASAAALTDNIHGMHLQMVKLDQQAVTQAALIREVKADEGNYLLYSNKREEERTSDALDQKKIANVAIAVPAVVPLLPQYGPLTIMFLGMVAGVFVAIASAYAMEYLDPSFRTPQEVADTLSIPVLATMPKKAA
jgi:polysaccharide biosynthesis protein PslE